jgi:hypothetical protein
MTGDGIDDAALEHLAERSRMRKRMISVIARQPSPSYLAAMAHLLFRLLALIAIVLMPMSGVDAPAMAQAPSAAETGHCSGHQQPAEDLDRKQAHCTACNALPALAGPSVVTELVPETPRLLTRIRGIFGVAPELATPPPKLA